MVIYPFRLATLKRTRVGLGDFEGLDGSTAAEAVLAVSDNVPLAEVEQCVEENFGLLSKSQR